MRGADFSVDHCPLLCQSVVSPDSSLRGASHQVCNQLTLLTSHTTHSSLSSVSSGHRTRVGLIKYMFESIFAAELCVTLPRLASEAKHKPSKY